MNPSRRVGGVAGWRGDRVGLRRSATGRVADAKVDTTSYRERAERRAPDRLPPLSRRTPSTRCRRCGTADVAGTDSPSPASPPCGRQLQPSSATHGPTCRRSGRRSLLDYRIAGRVSLGLCLYGDKLSSEPIGLKRRLRGRLDDVRKLAPDEVPFDGHDTTDRGRLASEPHSRANGKTRVGLIGAGRSVRYAAVPAERVVLPPSGTDRLLSKQPANHRAGFLAQLQRMLHQPRQPFPRVAELFHRHPVQVSQRQEQAAHLAVGLVEVV